MNRIFWWLAFLFLSVSWAGTVPDQYIVELTGEPAARRMAAEGRRANQVEVVRYRAAVQAEQAAASLTIEQAGGQVIGSIDTVGNALFVRMPASDAARLAALPGVKRVLPVRRFKLVLDHAVVVNKIVDAWNQIGLDQAGLGMKIAMIDTGIDNTHPGFQDPSLTIPPGFPKTNADSDKTYTNNKVIVARSYATMFEPPDPDLSARDDVGHGTGTAMAAGGVLNSGPLATIRGIAPKAYLGNYKVFGSPGVNDEAPDNAILKAIEDAVTDGMDVINLSLGDPAAITLADDPEVTAIQNATSMGAIVVVAAGNAGPDPHTVGSPGTAPTAITVGASANNRVFSGAATVGGTVFIAIPGTGPAPAGPITAPMVDVAKLDPTGLGCSSFPAGSLKGKIALILRGVCTFMSKLDNAQAGGAVAGLIYTDQARPSPITMDVGTATLPGIMVGYQDGSTIKARLAANPSLSGTLDFTVASHPIDPDQLADFTSKGPNVDGSIKPDLVAVGSSVYTAAQKTDSQGELYSPNGYLAVDGTSFSTPIVAGAAALLKAARPGLTVDQYRSLLIDSADPAFLVPGVPARVQQAGTGGLDGYAALRASGAASPTSLSFGIGSGNVQASQTLTISNVSKATETFSIFVSERDAPTGVIPPDSRTAVTVETTQPTVTVSTSSLMLAPGSLGTVSIAMTGFGLPAGAYEGFIHVLGMNSGVEQRVPYWYAVGSSVPAHLTLLDTTTTSTPGELLQAATFRVTDTNGIDVPGVKPTATVIDGGGAVLSIKPLEIAYPGVYALNVRLGPKAGQNDFQIQVGSLTQTVTVITQ